MWQSQIKWSAGNAGRGSTKQSGLEKSFGQRNNKQKRFSNFVFTKINTIMYYFKTQVF